MSFEHYYSGSQNPEDVEVLESVLKLYSGMPCRFVEIGVLTGQTARGIKRFCDEHGIVLEYWGIDSVSPETHNQPREPFPGANFVQGDSVESFHIPLPPFDVVLVDGCHCINHVMLETIHYGSRVKEGGWMLFHDTNPLIQHSMREPHGPDISQFYNSVERAHELLGFPDIYPWALLLNTLPRPDRKWGGMKAYRKMEL